jgi:hypothetical protein
MYAYTVISQQGSRVSSFRKSSAVILLLCSGLITAGIITTGPHATQSSSGSCSLLYDEEELKRRKAHRL